MVNADDIAKGVVLGLCRLIIYVGLFSLGGAFVMGYVLFPITISNPGMIPLGIMLSAFIGVLVLRHVTRKPPKHTDEA